jgi:hypothetical protein
MDIAKKYGVFTCFYKIGVVKSLPMKNTQNKPWFKAKRYGIGWVPASWQGWVITLTYSLIVVGSSVVFTRVATSSPDALGSSFASDILIGRFCIWIFILTLFFFWVCYKTGDAAVWHWNTGSGKK